MNYTNTLDELQSQGNLRRIPDEDEACGIINFSLNDYLGIASEQTMQREFFSDADNLKIPLTSSASRLLASDQKQYHDLELFLEQAYGAKALMFNSGYHANTGLVAALADKSTLIVADKLVHASIIDGIMLSKAPWTRFRHNDVENLQKILEKEASKYERVLLIVESVYSMDGDYAPLNAILDLKKHFGNVMIYVDEAHAIGVVGQNGLGLCSMLTKATDVDVRVGTLGKALASSGAFAIVNETVRQIAINRARSFIFSTALPPICCAYSRFVFSRTLQMDSRRKHLIHLSRVLAEGFRKIGLDTPTDDRYIMPIIIGDAKRTVEISSRLLDFGVKVLPIRTPTVPPGTERLRISLSAAMTEDDVDQLTKALAAIL